MNQAEELILEILRRDIAVVYAKIELMDDQKEAIGRLYHSAVTELESLRKVRRDLLAKAERIQKVDPTKSDLYQPTD